MHSGFSPVKKTFGCTPPQDLAETRSRLCIIYLGWYQYAGRGVSAKHADCHTMIFAKFLLGDASLCKRFMLVSYKEQ